MKEESTGWVVINEDHPNSEKEMLVTSSFAYTRKESIKKFIDKTGASWRYWYRKYNFRCVKAKATIETL